MWQNELVIIVRHMIDDVDSSAYDFSDDRIEEALLVCAQLVANDVSLKIAYTIEVDNRVLSPDPTSEPKDTDFIALCCLRTAILFTSSQIRTYSKKSIMIKDGQTSLDTTSIVNGFISLHKELLKQYEDMKLGYQVGNSHGKAILTPYSPGSDYANSQYDHFRESYY